MRQNSVLIVRLLFNALIIFSAAVILSTRVADSSVPMVLAVVLYTVILLRELSVEYSNPHSGLGRWAAGTLQRLGAFKYGGVALGGVVIAIFLALTLMASIIASLI
jgi:hypothetical protein